ncbi:MAG: TOBE domain-containing protein [Paraglaciecola sp.]|nr:TOBE domain-containing protein [Paraglaciecola sp.]
MADQIVVLHKGMVEQTGTPMELYNHPKNIFVAGFIGSPSMNFMEGVAELTDGGIDFRITPQLAIPLDKNWKGPIGEKITLGIRPEHLVVHESAVKGTLPAVVKVVEPTGPGTMISTSFNDTELTIVVHGYISLAPAQQIWLQPEADQLHFFDADGVTLVV